VTDDNPTEHFRPTNGRVFGILALVAAAAVALVAVIDREADVPLWVVGFAVLFGALAWTAMLRPGVALAGDTLVLRNMFTEATIPLAAIEDVAVRQFLVVRAGDKRYESPAIGRSRRQIKRSDAGSGIQASHQDTPYALFVEDRIRSRASDARDRLGIKPRSPEQAALADQAERRLAWPEIAMVSVAALAFVASILL